MQVINTPISPYVQNAPIAYCEETQKCIFIDPGDEIDKLIQVQEKLTVQIVDFLKKELETEDVACIIDAQHLCVSMRGIKDVNSWTTTAEYSGKFLEHNFKNEFLQLIVGENK